jgi:hypothetical protein
MKNAAIAATVTAGLIVPAQAGIYLPPKPAIVKPENLDFSKHMLLGMPLTMGMLAKRRKELSLVYVTSSVSNSDLSSYTLTNSNIGTAEPDRIVVVGATSRSGVASQYATGVTIGGAAATLISRSTGNDDTSSIWALPVASGSTATIVVSFLNTQVRAGFTIWALYGKSTSSYAASSVLSVGAPSGTQSVSTVAGGVAAAVAFKATDTLETPAMSQFTNNYKAAMNDNNGGSHYGFTANNTTAGTATINMSWITDSSITMAAWSPDP